MIYHVIYSVENSSDEYIRTIEADSSFQAELIVLSNLKDEYKTDKITILDIWERRSL